MPLLSTPTQFASSNLSNYLVAKVLSDTAFARELMARTIEQRNALTQAVNGRYAPAGAQTPDAPILNPQPLFLNPKPQTPNPKTPKPQNPKTPITNPKP
jgi:hypothetical protein